MSDLFVYRIDIAHAKQNGYLFAEAESGGEIDNARVEYKIVVKSTSVVEGST